MLSVDELYNYFDKLIPVSLSEDWDNDGLMVCADKNAAVSGVLFALDVDSDVIDHASRTGCNVIVTHHPLIFRKLSNLSGNDPTSSLAVKALVSGINVFSFHTRLDSVDFGVNKALADALGLYDIEYLSDGDTEGSIGLCGNVNEVSRQQFYRMVKNSLGLESLVCSRGGTPTVRRVAVVGGAGDDYIELAVRKGADTFITGEVHHHNFMLSKHYNINVISAGHFATEAPVLGVLAHKLLTLDDSVRYEIYNSDPTVTV